MLRLPLKFFFMAVTFRALVSVSDATAAGCPCNYTEAGLVSVVDGDTLVLEIAGEEEVVHIANIIVPRLEPDNTGQANWCEAEGQKALAAKQFIYEQIQATTEIAVDEQIRQPNGDLKAVVYLNNVSLGQELLYKSLAIEAGQKHNWCNSS
ncbi:MAG: hypothetical protein GY922_03175 [Proteobacteria bacterium]|nr:hypothetical protein [Pseudomonadota bacterium]